MIYIFFLTVNIIRGEKRRVKAPTAYAKASKAYAEGQKPKLFKHDH